MDDRLTEKVSEIAADLKSKARIRRQLSLIAAYTMRGDGRLRPMPPPSPEKEETK